MNYQVKWNQGMNYSEYQTLINELLEQGKSTGPTQSEALTHYSKMNAQRMSRIDKTLQLEEELVQQASELREHISFLTITEGWCGDAAQNLPVIEGVADAAEIQSRYVLRDEHTDLIDRHLTNGGRSIPIVLMLNTEKDQVLAQWGPRPIEAQFMVMDYKKSPEPKKPYEEFVKEVQLWYARNKQFSIQNELTHIIGEVAESLQVGQPK